MLPFEMIIDGPPLSLQARSRSLNAYKNRVRNIALSVWPSGLPPLNQPLQAQIIYYYENETPDVDNIVKPILDALNGVVYVDDSQMTDSKGSKRLLNGSYRIRNVSSVIAQAFSKGDEFTYVKIFEPEDLEILP